MKAKLHTPSILWSFLLIGFVATGCGDKPATSPSASAHDESSQTETTPLEEVSEELEEELRRAKFDQLFDDWIARLRQNHYVKVFAP